MNLHMYLNLDTIVEKIDIFIASDFVVELVKSQI